VLAVGGSWLSVGVPPPCSPMPNHHPAFAPFPAPRNAARFPSRCPIPANAQQSQKPRRPPSPKATPAGNPIGGTPRGSPTAFRVRRLCSRALWLCARFPPTPPPRLVLICPACSYSIFYISLACGALWLWCCRQPTRLRLFPSHFRALRAPSAAAKVLHLRGSCGHAVRTCDKPFLFRYALCTIRLCRAFARSMRWVCDHVFCFAKPLRV